MKQENGAVHFLFSSLTRKKNILIQKQRAEQDEKEGGEFLKINKKFEGKKNDLILEKRRMRFTKEKMGFVLLR